MNIYATFLEESRQAVMTTTTQQIGKYEIREEIGRGGFAIVYKAYDPSLDRVVALKLLHPAHIGQSDLIKRFVVEARRSARLRHPNIVHIYEVGEERGQPYIAMEYLPGGSLAQRKGEALFPVEMVLSIVEQVAAALDYAHRKNLIHRDVKPANILFDEENHAVLGDFGLVKSLVDSGLTLDGTRLGTPEYMAPEQGEPEASVGPPADIYALGVVAYKLLTGHVPFESETPLALLHAHIYSPPPDPRQFNAKLDEQVAAVLLKVLAKTPEARYPTAESFARALRESWKAGQRAAGTQATLADLYSRAQEAIHAGNWGAVVTLCVEMRNLDPDYRDVGALLTLAASWLAEEEQKRQLWRDLEEQYDAAVALLDAARYAEAVEALEGLEKRAPDYPGLDQQLDAARQSLENHRLYANALGRLEEGAYDAACADLLLLLDLDPTHPAACQALPEASAGVLEQLLLTRNDLFQAVAEIEVLQESMVALEARLDARQQAAALAQVSRLRYDEVLAALAGQKRRRAAQLLGELLEAEESPGACALWESLRPHLPQGARWVRPTDGKEMVQIPAGPFLYGPEATPLTLGEFWIDRTPITNAEYARFVAATGNAAPAFWGGMMPPESLWAHPVTQVSWNDAQAYAHWVGGRLPTEEEWEKAARGEDGRAYPWGEQFDPELCNTEESQVGMTTSVGRYSPAGDSGYGIADMAGNVWEWTASEYRPGLPHRVFRGGSFATRSDFARCFVRDRDYPLNHTGLLGFRVVFPGLEDDNV